MKQNIKKIFKILPEKVYGTSVILLNDCAVTDEEILLGRVPAVRHGAYCTDVSEGLHPLYKRGVDFTKVGDVLDSLDVMQEGTAMRLNRRRKELSSSDASNPDKSE